MATVETKNRYTPDDLLLIPEGKALEVVDGQFVVRDMSVLSSLVGGTLFSAIKEFACSRHLGNAWPSDVGLQCFHDDPDRLRRPDAAFVAIQRITEAVIADSFLRITPDLIAEVVSPNDGAYELERKIHEFLQAGVRLIWIVYPEQRTVRIHRIDGSTGWLTESGTLDGEDVLPGFHFAVRDLFATGAVSGSRN